MLIFTAQVIYVYNENDSTCNLVNNVLSAYALLYLHFRRGYFAYQVHGFALINSANFNSRL